MPTYADPQTSCPDGDWIIHPERPHRGTSNRRQTDYLRPILAPREVLGPTLLPGIVQWYAGHALGVYAFSLIRFVRVALRAGPTQIHLFRDALLRERDNMVYFQRNTGDALRSPAVFASIPQYLQPRPQSGRDASRIHRPTLS